MLECYMPTEDPTEPWTFEGLIWHLVDDRWRGVVRFESPQMTASTPYYSTLPVEVRRTKGGRPDRRPWSEWQATRGPEIHPRWHLPTR